ncbi:hypothetical protein HOG98_01740 [bacterium]|jgi:hypothetical protein|nr:hypothetical protein [bacterium]
MDAVAMTSFEGANRFNQDVDRGRLVKIGSEFCLNQRKYDSNSPYTHEQISINEINLHDTNISLLKNNIFADEFYGKFLTWIGNLSETEGTSGKPANKINLLYFVFEPLLIGNDGSNCFEARFTNRQVVEIKRQIELSVCELEKDYKSLCTEQEISDIKKTKAMLRALNLLPDKDIRKEAFSFARRASSVISFNSASLEIEEGPIPETYYTQNEVTESDSFVQEMVSSLSPDSSAGHIDDVIKNVTQWMSGRSSHIVSNEGEDNDSESTKTQSSAENIKMLWYVFTPLIRNTEKLEAISKEQMKTFKNAVSVFVDDLTKDYMTLGLSESVIDSIKETKTMLRGLGLLDEKAFLKQAVSATRRASIAILGSNEKVDNSYDSMDMPRSVHNCKYEFSHLNTSEIKFGQVAATTTERALNSLEKCLSRDTPKDIRMAYIKF